MGLVVGTCGSVPEQVSNARGLGAIPGAPHTARSPWASLVSSLVQSPLFKTRAVASRLTGCWEKDSASALRARGPGRGRRSCPGVVADVLSASDRLVTRGPSGMLPP